MPIGINPKMDSLVLTKGTGFQATFHDTTDWPAGAQAQLTFYDTAGGVFTVFDGVFGGKDIVFNETAAAVDIIPHGASFEFTVTLAGYDPVAMTYGMAVRKEPRFPDAPPSSIDDTALLFQDTFQRVDLGPRWIQKSQAAPRHINAGIIANTNGLSGMAPVKSAGNASALWYAPLNGDDATVNVQIYNGNKFAGMQSTIVCSDYSMSTYLAFVVVVGKTTNLWHLSQGTAPVGMDPLATVTHTTATIDNFAIIYNSLSDTLLVYHNNDFSAPAMSVSGVDTPHGPGYRYVGTNFVDVDESSHPTGGPCPQLLSWRAQDGVVLPTP